MFTISNLKYAGVLLFLSSVSFASGIYNPGSGSGGGGGGSSSLEVFSNYSSVHSSPTASVGVGNGLAASVIGSTFSFSVDYSSIPSRSNAVLVNPSGAQDGYFWIVAGTIAGGPFNVYGPIVIDTPTVAPGFGANRSSLSFDPRNGTSPLIMRSYSSSAGSGGILWQDSSGNNVVKWSVPPQLSGVFAIQKATDSVVGETNRYQIQPQGKHIFGNVAGTTFIEFDPVNNSSFTVPIFASSESINGQLQAQTYKFADGTTQITAATSGSGAGTLEVFNNFDNSRSCPTASIGLSNDFSGNVTGSTYAVSVKMQKLGTPQYWTLQDFFNLSLSPGQSSGGAISQASASTVNVSSGTGFIKPLDANTTTNYFMTWASSSGVSVPVGNTVYIGVKYNAGVPVVSTKAADSWDLDTEFPLGTVVNESGRMAISTIPWITADNMANVIERFDSLAPVSRDNRSGGLVLSNTGTRNVAVTAGTLLARMGEFSTSAIDTSVSGTFDNYYRNGSGGFTVQRSSTQWNNTNYDDNSGTLATLTALNYTSRWFYLMIDGSLASLYGQAQYTTLAGALNDGTPSSVPDRILRGGLLIGRFIIQASGATPTTTQSAFGTSFTAASVTNFSDLAGTADISSQTNLTATSPLALSGDAMTITAISLSTGVTGLLPDANIADVSASKLKGNNLPAGSTNYWNNPSTMTAVAKFGIITTTEVITSLSPGVLHTVAVSSDVKSGLVSLSTEVTGSLPDANISDLSTSKLKGTNLPPGSTTYWNNPSTMTILTSQGLVTSSLTVNNGLYINQAVKTSNYTLAATDSIILTSCTASGGCTMTIPSGLPTNQLFTFVKVDSSSQAATIRTTSPELLFGTTNQTYLFAMNASGSVTYDGQNRWWPRGKWPSIPPTVGIYSDPNTAQGVATSSNTNYVAVYVPEPCTAYGLRFVVGVAAGKIDAGLFDANTSTGAPMNKLASTGSITTPAAGINNVTFTSDVNLMPGTYWMAIQPSEVTTTIARAGIDQVMGCVTQANTGATLPTLAQSTSNTSARPWAIALLLRHATNQ